MKGDNGIKLKVQWLVADEEWEIAIRTIYEYLYNNINKYSNSKQKTNLWFCYYNLTLCHNKLNNITASIRAAGEALRYSTTKSDTMLTYLLLSNIYKDCCPEESERLRNEFNNYIASVKAVC